MPTLFLLIVRILSMQSIIITRREIKMDFRVVHRCVARSSRQLPLLHFLYLPLQNDPFGSSSRIKQTKLAVNKVVTSLTFQDSIAVVKFSSKDLVQSVSMQVRIKLASTSMTGMSTELLASGIFGNGCEPRPCHNDSDAHSHSK